MKKWLGVAGLVCAMTATAAGQVTNVMLAETSALRLEWKAFPHVPYRVLSTPDIVEPVWSNVAPDGMVFTNSQGSYSLNMDEPQRFYCAVPSDYLIVDLSEGPTATNYPVSYTNAIPDGGWGDEYKTTKMVMRRILGGNFSMGSPTNELGRGDNEPRHAVTLTKGYYIGVFEVTQKQWERVMGVWPSYFTNISYRDSRPVEEVSYNDIRGTVAGTNWPENSSVDTNSFMGLLRAKTGQAFDLPTDAQWEHACRAGTATALNSGYNLTNTLADTHMDVVGRYWYNGGSGYSSTGDDISVGSAKVGSYLPNAWGLYDMHGNVWEWCLDWYESAPAVEFDPSGPILGSGRVGRGGSWLYDGARYCRSAYRGSGTPGHRVGSLGFRGSLPPGQ